MSIIYTPDADDALFDEFTGQQAQDPRVYTSPSPERMDAKYFGKPIQDEILNLIKISGQLRVKRFNPSTSDIEAGDLLYVVGYNSTLDRLEVGLADMAYWEQQAVLVATETIAASDSGYAAQLAEITGIDTSTLVVGDMVYLSTDGAWQAAEPGSTEAEVTQIVGVVTEADVSGSIKFFPGYKIIAPGGGGGGGTSVHNDLTGLQGGTTDEYYHLTATEHTEATQNATAAQDGLMSSSYANKLDGIEFNADVTDATNVAAAGAIMDSDFAGSQTGHMRRTGAGTYEVVKDNLTGVGNPDNTNDDSEGYAVGSRWFDSINQNWFICIDATTNNAVWHQFDLESHNDLSGLQGGQAGEYYHLTNDEHTEATRDATSSQNGLMTAAYASKLDLLFCKNALINGDARVKQANDYTPAAVSTYGMGVDMWKGKVEGDSLPSVTFTRDTAAAVGRTGYAHKCSISTGATNAVGYWRYRVDAETAARFEGQAATFSCLVRQDSGSSKNFTITVRRANAANNFSSTTVLKTGSASPVSSGTNTTLSLSLTSGETTNAKYGIEIEIKFIIGTPATFSVWMTEAQLEEGATATDFERRNYEVEHSMVYAWYEVIGLMSTGTYIQYMPFANGMLYGGSSANWGDAPQSMMGTLLYHKKALQPAVQYLGSVSDFKVGNWRGSSSNASALSFQRFGYNRCWMSVTPSSTTYMGTGGAGSLFRQATSAKIEIDATL